MRVCEACLGAYLGAFGTTFRGLISRRRVHPATVGTEQLGWP